MPGTVETPYPRHPLGFVWRTDDHDADGDARKASDAGITITRGAAMLSALLACAFIGRQVWGFVADRSAGCAPSSPARFAKRRP
jgi:hypothetical protein